MNIVSQIAKKLFVVPTYARRSEALHTILAHSTPRRLFNLMLVETEYRLRRTRVHGRPYVLVIDPANVCNLRCPLCPTGLLQTGRRSQMITWETFTHIVDMAAPWAYKLNLFNWGEPLLHSHVFDMIRYARKKGLGTTMSTNLSVDISDADIDQLLTCGVEFLCLSIDGATQETYAKYRRKGKLDLVLHNLDRLVRRRKELGLKRPVIEWQFIPMRHNEHEEDAARELAHKHGADRFRCIPVGLPFEAENRPELEREWFPIKIQGGETAGGEEISSNDQSPKPCYFLYRYLVVNPDGKTSPCCVVYGEPTDFGDLTQEPLDALWNNAQYCSGRAQYSSSGRPTVPTVCDRCDLFAKRSRYTPAPASQP
ncbi:MAG: radical SAM protein [Pseudomonadota bacterium]